MCDILMKNASREKNIMQKLLSAQADITKRLQGHTERQFISDTFLRELNNILSHAREVKNKHILQDKLWDHLLTYKTDLQRIQYEIARIPAMFIVKKQLSHRGNGYQTIESIGLKTPHNQRTLHPQEQDYPEDVPELETLSDGDTVWCLCSPKQVSDLGYTLLPCWPETDSLVNWITQYLQNDTEPEMENPLPKEQQTTIPTFKTDIEQKVTPKQRIYHYIQTHAPVSTDDILAQRFAGRSRTFAILKALQRDDKIEKVAHGVYQTPKKSNAS